LAAALEEGLHLGFELFLLIVGKDGADLLPEFFKRFARFLHHRLAIAVGVFAGLGHLGFGVGKVAVDLPLLLVTELEFLDSSLVAIEHWEALSAFAAGGLFRFG